KFLYEGNLHKATQHPRPFSFLLLSLAFPSSSSSFTLESNYCFCYNAAWLLYSYRFHLPGSHLAARLGLRTTRQFA
ncbi:unnamed protein product, partial [Callosobruchus maculatus]